MSNSKRNQLHEGMNMDEIVQLLGQPISSAGGDDIMPGFGSGKLRGRAWYTWRCPEGTYTLTIQDGRLANIQNAPD